MKIKIAFIIKKSRKNEANGDNNRIHLFSEK